MLCPKYYGDGTHEMNILGGNGFERLIYDISDDLCCDDALMDFVMYK